MQEIKGVGMGYISELHVDTIENLSEYDFIEITPENFFGSPLSDNQAAKDIKGKIPVTLHGIDLSLASSTDITEKKELLNKIKEVSDFFEVPFYSEHLSFTNEKDIDLDLYIPPVFIEESVEKVVANIKRLKNILNLDFHMENVATLIKQNNNPFYSDYDYVSKVCKLSDSGLILNLDSIAISSHIYKIDPMDLLVAYPLEQVISVTVVPESCMNPILKKSYGKNIDQLMWSMLEYVFNHSGADSVLIQRRFPGNTTESLKKEIDIAKSIFTKTKILKV